MTGTFDVIIVGGGPVGLLLACLLKTSGARFVLLEKRTQGIAHSAAIGITPPSLRILDKLGLAREFIDSGVQVRDCYVHGRGGRLGCVSFRDLPDEYRFILSLPQATTMAILQKRLGGEAIRLGCEVTGLAQHRDHCLVRTSGEEFRARFVAGCDGHRSRVRDLIGMPVRSRSYGCHFVMGDFPDRSGFGQDAHLFFTASGAVESFPLPAGQRRWIVQTDPCPERRPEGLVSRLTRQRTGIDLPETGQINESAFTPGRLQSACYYRGRVVLCGDAAHVMSPIGGQGLNTGFADAELLAEALGRADPLEWLPAYDRFRRRAAASAMVRAEWGMWLGTWRGKGRSALREVILQFLLRKRTMARHLPSIYAMLNIPCNTLDGASRDASKLRTT